MNTVKGYAIHDTDKWSEFKVIEYELKKEEDFDVTLDIEYCGVCASDLHTITGGWGKIADACVVGHEIVGKVVKVGPKVTEFKVGDRAGVGAQVFSCLDCKLCKSDNENYCPEQVDTYNANYPNGDKAQGGYSSGIRVNERFVFAIPDALEASNVPPFFCAGLTVYSPLKRNGCGPGKKVGICGVGGLGHFAIQFAKAMGAEVYVFSHSPSKDEDIKKLGGDHIIHTGDKDFAKPLAYELDLIVSTVDVASGLPVSELLKTLNIGASFISVGLPDEPLEGIQPMSFMGNACRFGSSHIGSKVDCQEMLALSAEKGIKAWTETVPMSDVSNVVTRMKNGEARYRFVLQNDNKF